MKHLHPDPVPADDPQGVSEADQAVLVQEALAKRFESAMAEFSRYLPIVRFRGLGTGRLAGRRELA